ncbi:MAG: class I SAM-dependent methyltransferase [Spirochaetales bacterium]|nr:MAG: class I SAM-dependent methyltransferase [Spirochaetales bacterium]
MRHRRDKRDAGPRRIRCRGNRHSACGPAATQRARAHVVTAQVDLAKPLPFRSGEFDVVIANLCLHYFDTPTTEGVLSEIARVLNPDGLLLARVNSFDDDMVQKFLADWVVLSVDRHDINRYKAPKNVYEITARRPGSQ